MVVMRVENGIVVAVGDDVQMRLREERLYDAALFESDSTMYEAFDWLIANSEWDWIAPEEVGALTSAPMLGIRDEDGRVIEAYAFMSYQVRSVQGDLADNGKAFFQSGD